MKYIVNHGLNVIGLFWFIFFMRVSLFLSRRIDCLLLELSIQQAMVLLHCTYMFKLVIGASRTSLVRFTSMGPGFETDWNGIKNWPASERASEPSGRLWRGKAAAPPFPVHRPPFGSLCSSILFASFPNCGALRGVHIPGNPFTVWHHHYLARPAYKVLHASRLTH